MAVYPTSKVGASTKPGSPSPSTGKGKSNVAGASTPATVSGDKSASNMGGVTLGTTKNNHNVAHRISGLKNHGPGQVPGGKTV